MDLNIPEIRQSLLADRLRAGQQIVAQDVAAEFGISVDTIRRDILALAAAGQAHRVRGGAVPPAAPLHVRQKDSAPVDPTLVALVITHIDDAPTLLLDGGTTVLALVPALTVRPDRLVITPSPWVAIACQERGVGVFLLGGTLSARGGIATGAAALREVDGIAADIAVLGACGLDAGFGLSSDDHAEALMKQAMQHAAAQTIVVTDAQKLGRKARHHTLHLNQIDHIFTNTRGDHSAALAAAGAEISAPDHPHQRS